MSARMAGRGWVLLLVLWLGTASPAAWAVLCSEVWPTNSGLNQNVPPLNLPSFSASTSLVASNPRTVTVGDSYWLGGTSSTNWRLNAPSAGTARVYVKGNLYIDNNSRINASGSAKNLILIIDGNLIIANSNNTLINALVYATGNATLGNNPDIIGGVSVVGSLSHGNNVNYEPGVVAGADFGSLCDNPDAVNQIDHYRFEHAASGLSCNPLDVLLKVCATASCDRLYQGSINISLSPATWVGGNTLSFYGGQRQLQLHGTGAVTLGISSVVPAASNPRVCSTSNCVVNFTAAGLQVQAPDLIAGKPDTLTVTAAAGCVAAFANLSRPVQFWSSYLNPDVNAQVGNRAVLLGGSAISGAAGSPTPLTLNFNASGQASTSLSYADAGQMRIDASYVGSTATGDAGASMSGSATFVSRPYGLHLSSDRECTAASVAGCAQTQVAGDAFSLRIRPVAWQADGEAHTAAALADNATTPNFRLAGIALGSSLQAPAGGNPGGLSLASYSHALGGQNSLSLSQSEVGVFRLTAMAPASGYFGYTIPAASSALTGRFIPARLQAAVSASLTPACGTFSYQQQWIDFSGGGPLLVVTGLNRQGSVTGNYDMGEFWRLAAPQRDAYASVSGRSALDARLEESGSLAASPQADGIAADGSRQYLWADQLRWSAALVPSGDDLPLPAASPAVRLSIAAARLTDADGVCFDAGGGCSALVWDFGGSELRLGRLRFGEAYGSELQALEVPFWLESWQDNGGVQAFLPEAADSCSAPLLGSPALQAVAGAGTLQPADLAGAATVLPLAGQGGVSLPAPGVAGSVLTGLSGLAGGALPWLEYDWNGDGSREAGSGLATFGIHARELPLIYRREGFR